MYKLTTLIFLLLIWFLSSQADVLAQQTPTNRIELVQRINVELERLSELDCSLEIVDELAELLAMHYLLQELDSRSAAQEHNFMLMSLHAKIGLIYEASGDIEFSELNFSTAMKLGEEVNSRFSEREYFDRTITSSGVGCKPSSAKLTAKLEN